MHDPYRRVVSLHNEPNLGLSNQNPVSVIQHRVDWVSPRRARGDRLQEPLRAADWKRDTAGLPLNRGKQRPRVDLVAALGGSIAAAPAGTQTSGLCSGPFSIGRGDLRVGFELGQFAGRGR